MKRPLLLALSVFFVLSTSACKTDDAKSDGGSEVEAADAMDALQGINGITAADRQAWSKQMMPLYQGPGYEETCVGCLAHWAVAEDPNKLNNPTSDWLALQRKCREKGQCKTFDYVNAWSPTVLIAKTMKGPNGRWAEWKKQGKKVACFYTDAYYSGQEICYEGLGRAILPGSHAGKISSYKVLNIPAFVARNSGSQKVERFEAEQGYNLLPEYADKIAEIAILNLR